MISRCSESLVVGFLDAFVEITTERATNHPRFRAPTALPDVVTHPTSVGETGTETCIGPPRSTIADT